MKVVILYGEVAAGAAADEQDALVQVEAIASALRQLDHLPVALPFSLDLQGTLDALQQMQPVLVFNIVESVAGQGRLIHFAPALLDALRLPYTGARTDAIFLTSNKLLAKQWMESADIPTPRWFAWPDLQREAPVAADRYIIKSVWEHASVGLSEDSIITAADSATLRAALGKQQQFLGGEGFIEAYIEGREFNLALLAGDHGPEMLPPAEIDFEGYPAGKSKIVDYRAKWEEQSAEYRQTVRRFTFPPEDGALLQRLQTLARRCWELFALRGYARVDFRVDAAGAPWVLEINTNPCLSPDAGFAAATQQAGLAYTQVIDRILKAHE